MNMEKIGKEANEKEIITEMDKMKKKYKNKFNNAIK